MQGANENVGLDGGIGLPFSLLFPTDTYIIELEMRLRDEKKLETKKDSKAFMETMSKDERKARNKAWNFLCYYNSIQSEHSII